MTTLPCMWTLIDPEANKARWYYMTTSKDLFGDTVLIRRWGRINRRGQERFETFESDEALEKAVHQIIKRRLQHGYRPS